MSGGCSFLKNSFFWCGLAALLPDHTRTIQVDKTLNHSNNPHAQPRSAERKWWPKQRGHAASEHNLSLPLKPDAQRSETEGETERIRLHPWVVRGAWLLLLLPLLFVANLVSLYLHGGSYHVEMGDGVDKLLFHNVYSTEEDPQGQRYRWTRGESTLHIQSFASVSGAWLTLNIGGLPDALPVPRPLQLTLDSGEHTSTTTTLPVTHMARKVSLLLPPDALHDGTLEVGLSSERSRVEPDPRRLGVRIDGFTLHWFPGTLALPTWPMLLVQWCLVVSIIAIGWRLTLPRWSLFALGAGTVLALGWMTGQQLLVAGSWQNRLLLATAALLALFWSTLPLLQRMLPAETATADLRWLWLITLLSFVIRMGGVLYPPFDSHDWYIHRDRIYDFIGGSMLVYDHPAEFSKKLTIVPSAPYILYQPFTLLVNNVVVAMQGVYAMFDSLVPLFLGLFVRRTGGSGRAACFAALLVALFPLNFTALWWGFGPQVIGQTLVMLMALFVVYDHSPDSDYHNRPFGHSSTFWVLAMVVFVVLLLTHIGAGILGGFCLAGYTVLRFIFHRREPLYWKWGVLLIASGILVTFLLYIDVIALQLRGLSGNQNLGWDEGDIFRVIWSLESLYISFKPLVAPLLLLDTTEPGMSHLAATALVVVPALALPLLSLVYLVRAVHSPYRWLVMSWIGSGALFFLIDLLFGLQVRYAYFVMPMVVAGLALLLDRLSVRHWAALLVAWCLILLVGIAGLNPWVEGIFMGIKPSLRGLTH
jgi:hypothetical protein